MKIKIIIIVNNKIDQDVVYIMETFVILVVEFENVTIANGIVIIIVIMFFLFDTIISFGMREAM